MAWSTARHTLLLDTLFSLHLICPQPRWLLVNAQSICITCWSRDLLISWNTKEWGGGTQWGQLDFLCGWCALWRCSCVYCIEKQTTFCFIGDLPFQYLQKMFGTILAILHNQGQPSRFQPIFRTTLECSLGFFPKVLTNFSDLQILPLLGIVLVRGSACLQSLQC